MSPPKSSKRISFDGLLKSPDAFVQLRFAGTTSFSLRLEAKRKGDALVDFGFHTDGPVVFALFLSRSLALFLNQSSTTAESITLSSFHDSLSPSPDEKEYSLFVWNAIQDVIARLPFDDPLSKMLGKISRMNDEFPLGDGNKDDDD
ncbi:MAG: hypothetical protein V1776_00500 [Candidatus Diapherotrites archaeon]